MDDFYNSNCTEKCGHCLNAESCDKKNGSCSECQPNFEFPLCKGNQTLMMICKLTNLDIYNSVESGLLYFTECKNGFYNNRCSEACGQCANNEICEKETGNCSEGCITNFLPPLCKGIVYLIVFIMLSNRSLARRLITIYANN